MSSTLRFVLVSCAALIAWLGALQVYRNSTRPTFTRDIAPIGYRHCAPCHRPGQPGPFSLLDYDDYREHASDIADVVEDRYMPPWKPSDRSGKFAGQRTLSDSEIALFRRWVAEGAARGDAADSPALPKWPKGWSLGKPDVVVQLTAAYELPASGEDEYRNFVIPSPVHDTRYVVGWEFKPESRAIHHAILKVDRLGNARRADESDPSPGFADMEFDGAQSPDGFYLVWAPGKTPARPSDGSAWRIDANTDLVLQLHLQHRGKRESIRPLIALYLSNTPPSARRFSMRIGDVPIDIPAGAHDYRISDSFTLAADVRLLSLFPHAHYLAKTMRVFSRLPDGHQLELLRIADWDFKWQDEYTFAAPPLLPRGSTLQMEFSYDNSSSNPHNPSDPPVRVRTGERSRDEMGNVTFQALPVRATELDVLLESKYRRLLGADPTPEALYNLANALSREGKRDEAIAYYLKAIAKKPDFASARFNIAGLFMAQGQQPRAIEQLRQVVELRPGDRDAQLALGRALELNGELDAAIAQYRHLVTSQPEQRIAQQLLDSALQRRATPVNH